MNRLFSAKKPSHMAIAAFALLLGSLISGIYQPKAHAQVLANQTIINWSTNTYVPVGFTGKRLPTSGSTITAWITVISGGTPTNISSDLIHWYSNSALIQSGTGLQKITFKAPAGQNQVITLSAQIIDPSGAIPEAAIQVPIISPRAAILSTYSGGVLTSGTADVTALPYFFNVSSPSGLSYSWSANNVKAGGSENPNEALINVGNLSSGTPVLINLTVANSSDKTSADASLNLVYQKL